MMVVSFRVWMVVVLVFPLCLVMSASASEIEAGAKIELPKPMAKGDLSLEEVLWKRHSIREFSDKTPDWKQVGQLLWAAQGVNRPENQHRTSPSAFGAYPLQVYVILPSGFFHYLPNEHAVVCLKTGDVWKDLAETVAGKSTHDAPCVFIISADFSITEKRSEKEEAKRYVLLEGGHAAQNILLQVISLGMGAVSIGAPISPDEQKITGIPCNEKPIYIISTGFPK